ncbi:MAG: helix-turn-helix domain-containing protein [Candidatus Peregrinibacteria bacterium]
MEKFFTTEQVANILQVHPFTILKFIKEGKLKGIKLGRVYRITESNMQKFLEERMTEPKSKKTTSAPVEKEKEKKEESKPNYEVSREKGEEGGHYYII